MLMIVNEDSSSFYSLMVDLLFLLGQLEGQQEEKAATGEHKIEYTIYKTHETSNKHKQFPLDFLESTQKQTKPALDLVKNPPPKKLKVSKAQTNQSP